MPEQENEITAKLNGAKVNLQYQVSQLTFMLKEVCLRSIITEEERIELVEKIKVIQEGKNKEES